MLIRSLFVLLASVLLVSCSPPGVLQDLSQDWTVSTYGGGVQTLDLPGIVELPGNGWYRAEKTFLADDAVTQSRETWLSLGSLDFPCEVTFNGEHVYRRGTLSPNTPWVQASDPAVFLVSPSQWSEGENTLSLVLYSPGRQLRLSSPALVGDGRFAAFEVNVVQLLNQNFFFLFAGINFVGGLYFLTMWWGRRSDWSRLYFALSTLFMAFYFFEQGSPVPLFEGTAYRPLMKGCLSFSIGFVVAFFLEFFELHNKRWLRATALTLFGLVGLFVALSPDNPTTMDRFTLSLLPLEVAILFVLYLQVRALINRHPEAGTIFVGTLLAIGFGTHDVVYQMQGKIPVAWLQGMGFFALQGSMFFSLALQSTRLYRTLEDTSRAFARFVPREFLAILGKPSINHVALGDQVQKNMAILFSDIRDFTALSERLTPDQNFNLINAYLNKMAPEVRRHGGIIDSYIGDAIMALYPAGSPGAIRSALAMRASLIEYNAGRARAGYSPLEMGIGIHTGSLMLGTIGDEHRMDTTVISDSVNTGSRLEGLTKVFGVPILLSQSALEEASSIRDDLAVRFLGSMPVRGRSQGLALYELVHPLDPLCTEKLRHRAAFEDAVRTWEDSRSRGTEKFQAYRQSFPDDPVLGYFLR